MMTGAGGRPASYTQDALERVVEELEAEGGVVDAQRVRDRLVAQGEATPGARLDGMQPRIERHLAEREEARRTAWRRRVPDAMRGEVAEVTEELARSLEVMLGQLHERLEEEALRRVEEVERDKRAHARRADDLEVEVAETKARLADAERAREEATAERDAARDEARGLAARVAETEAEREALRARVAELTRGAEEAEGRLAEVERARKAAVEQHDTAREEVVTLGGQLRRAKAEVEGLRAGLIDPDALADCVVRRLGEQSAGPGGDAAAGKAPAGRSTPGDDAPPVGRSDDEGTEPGRPRGRRSQAEAVAAQG